MARNKSINDIKAQAKRIEDELLNRGIGGANPRFKKVEQTSADYTRNIGKRIGKDEVSQRGYWFYDDTVDRNRKMPRNVYMGIAQGGQG